MKNTKKAMCLATGIITSLAMMTTPVFASNTTANVVETQAVTESGDSTCKVVMEKDSDYTITLPKEVTLSSATKSGEFNFSLTGDIAGNEYITVTSNPTFAMTCSGKPNVDASVSISTGKFRSNGTTKTLASDEAKMSAGGKISITASGLTAGHWEGTLTVNIATETDS